MTLTYEFFLLFRGLADVNGDGQMDVNEFSIACKLITMKLKNVELPKALPPSLMAGVAPQPGMMPGMAGMPVSSAGMAMPGSQVNEAFKRLGQSKCFLKINIGLRKSINTKYHISGWSLWSRSWHARRLARTTRG